MKIEIVPNYLTNKDLHQIMISAVSPRPIAFVSTVDDQGNKNLAPYSFFNMFSSNPPIVVFSSNRKGRDNTTKDTLHNVIASRECVINIVPHGIVGQMALASVEYPNEVNEFEKTGLTPEPSLRVKPARVAESPVNFECIVKDIITLGDKGGAGHLIICEIVNISLHESVMTDGVLDQHKLDLVGRLGKNYYVRASGNALFQINQITTKIPLGFDGLPADITGSEVLTGNEISTLASLFDLPDPQQLCMFTNDHPDWILMSVHEKHQKAKILIKDQHIEDALCLLMS